jgi:hypothetical protein
MVACCHYLAHYLQCTDILDKIVCILKQSIDAVKMKYVIFNLMRSNK